MLKISKGTGTGNVTITSSYDPNSGNWQVQNFITISGENVTIQDVDLQANKNSFYDTCNKVIELVDDAKNFKMKNVDLLPLSDENGRQFSGSIFFNVTNAGNSVLEDVTMYSWISASKVTDGTVTASNIVQDFTNNSYAGYSDLSYGYAWNPGISGSDKNIAVDDLTIKVDNQSEFIKQIAEYLIPGTTIELMSDITLSEEFYINKVDNITINGNGHTITAAKDFKMNTEGQIQLVKIQESDGVTLNNVKLVGTEQTKHTLDVWGATNVVLNDVTLDHENASSGAPLVINGSSVAVTGSLELITGNNSWYGANIDNKNGDASLTFEEDSTLAFKDNSTAANKWLIYAEKDPNSSNGLTVDNKSDKFDLNADGNGNYTDVHVHSFSTEWKSDADKHWNECACGEKANEADHTFGDWKVTKEASETEKGSKERACSVCGYTEIVEIPEVGHTHDYGTEWKSDANKHWNECACGEKANEAEHTFGDWKVTKEASETEKGSKERTCSVCGYTETVEIPATGSVKPPVMGDSSNIALWISFMVLAAGGMTASVFYARKRKQR